MTSENQETGTPPPPSLGGAAGTTIGPTTTTGGFALATRDYVDGKLALVEYRLLQVETTLNNHTKAHVERYRWVAPAAWDIAKLLIAAGVGIGATIVASSLGLVRIPGG